MSQRSQQEFDEEDTLKIMVTTDNHLVRSPWQHLSLRVQFFCGILSILSYHVYLVSILCLFGEFLPLKGQSRCSVSFLDSPATMVKQQEVPPERKAAGFLSLSSLQKQEAQLTGLHTGRLQPAMHHKWSRWNEFDPSCPVVSAARCGGCQRHQVFQFKSAFTKRYQLVSNTMSGGKVPHSCW
jgi:hypothetical protein